MKQLIKLYGIDHRLITPYHPRANGLVERTNKEVGRGLKKQLEGAKDCWNEYLPTIQLGLNQRILERTGSTPFSLIHGRPFNDLVDFSQVEVCSDLEKAVISRKHDLETLKNLVLPAIGTRNTDNKKKHGEQFDSTMKQQNILQPGTQVMALDMTRASKWDPIYEGPFTVVKLSEGGAYVLKDKTGEQLKRQFAMESLKEIPDITPLTTNFDSVTLSEGVDTSLVNKEKVDKILLTKPKELHYEVQDILSHQLDQDGKSYSYLVHWKGYAAKFDSWVLAKDFDDLNIIKKYWNRIQPKKIQVKNKKKPQQEPVRRGTRKRVASKQQD